MKPRINASNHTDDYECQLCGFIFDRHLHGPSCPNCGKDSLELSQLRTKLKLIASVCLLLIFFSSCAPQHHIVGKRPLVERLQKQVRHHKNHLSQQGCRMRGNIDQNYSRRPTGSWPFQFLQ